MPTRKKTLRKLPETSRKLARLMNELESVLNRTRNLATEIQRLEHDSIAFMRASAIVNESKERKPARPGPHGPWSGSTTAGPDTLPLFSVDTSADASADSLQTIQDSILDAGDSSGGKEPGP